MTEPAAPAQHAVIAAEPDSRLEQLAAEYAMAKPAADAAKARLESVTDAIKYELTAAAPGMSKIDLNATVLDAPLRMSARSAWTLDTTRMKAEAPETYARYARQRTYWELRVISRRGPS